LKIAVNSHRKSVEVDAGFTAGCPAYLYVDSVDRKFFRKGVGSR
jgi:hypothetical protein